MMIDLEALKQELKQLTKDQLLELAMPQAVRLKKAGQKLAGYQYGGSRRSGVEARIMRAFEAVAAAAGHGQTRFSDIAEAEQFASEHGLEAVLKAIQEKAQK